MLLAVVGMIYFRSSYRKLLSTDKIYSELKHPEWSERVIREKAVRPNPGSGDNEMLYLIDVRRVRVPISEAVAYYDREVERLGFKECHVDTYDKAHFKFAREWSQMNLEVPSGYDILVISQVFPSDDGNIRRHTPAEQPLQGGAE
jgi:hypothetical protein